MKRLFLKGNKEDTIEEEAPKKKVKKEFKKVVKEEKEETKKEEKVVEEIKEEKEDLTSKTLAELKTMAKEKGLKGYSTMKKDELISILK